MQFKCFRSRQNANTLNLSDFTHSILRSGHSEWDMMQIAKCVCTLVLYMHQVNSHTHTHAAIHSCQSTLYERDSNVARLRAQQVCFSLFIITFKFSNLKHSWHRERVDTVYACAYLSWLSAFLLATSVYYVNRRTSACIYVCSFDSCICVCLHFLMTES